MVKVIKDLNNIPSSLIPSFEDFFPERIGKKNLVPIPLSSRITHERRMQVINAGVYNDEINYNNRYKVDDIRQALNNVYKGKCAFCEQKEEQTHIEHYRPKKIYYWLAYSWDNLLLACPTCNEHKGTNFDLDGERIAFENSEINIKSINISSAGYDATELPKMVNPEITDPSGEIYFEQDGNIKSDNPRFHYTIQKCKIDRKALNDKRRSILDRFREHIRDAFIVNSSIPDQLIAIETNFRNFVNDLKNEETEFLAFRNYAVKKDWLKEIIKTIN